MIIGIDEVGRGCWAGPLVAAAVGLQKDHGILGLDDSKKLSAKKRVLLVHDIKQSTKQIGIGWVWPREINKKVFSIIAYTFDVKTMNIVKILDVVIDKEWNIRFSFS